MATEDESRISDFENGTKSMENQEYDNAIDSFQECMKKLSHQGLGLTSELFPKCLQNLANCYNEKGDMEKALSFKKFEKLYYETVLLHNGLDGLLNKDDGEESTRERGDGSGETFSDITMAGTDTDEMEGTSKSPVNQTIKSAMEYEQLARLCLQQDCVSLALEYAGKATLLYKHHYGEDHEETKKSYKLFTSIYAEAGKEEYSNSLEHARMELPISLDLLSSTSETELRQRKTASTSDNNQTPKSKPLRRTRSILKKKGSGMDGASSDQEVSTPEGQVRRVTFADPLPQMVRLRDDDEHDSSSNFLLFFLICLIMILVSLLVSSMICRMYPSTSMCIEFRREFTFYYSRLRYFHNTYFK